MPLACRLDAIRALKVALGVRIISRILGRDIFLMGMIEGGWFDTFEDNGCGIGRFRFADRFLIGDDFTDSTPIILLKEKPLFGVLVFIGLMWRSRCRQVGPLSLILGIGLRLGEFVEGVVHNALGSAFGKNERA